MNTELVYFAAQVVAINTLVLIGLSLLVSQPKNKNAQLFALICLSNISYMISNMGNGPNPMFRIDLSDFWLPMQIATNMGMGFLMILCHSLFQEKRRFPNLLLLLFGIQIGLSASRPLFVPNRLSEIDIGSIGDTNYFVFGTLPLLLQSSFVLYALYWTVRGWRSDLVENRRFLRGLILSLFSLFFLGTVIANLYFVSAQPAQIAAIGGAFTYLSAAGFILFALVCLRFEVRIFDLVVERMKQGGAPDRHTGLDSDLETFHRVFRDEKGYLEPGLSISNLAKKMSVPQYRLRMLINKKLGYRNFNALLNEYRIQDACNQLSDPNKSSLPILTIALTVGFQSIAPFNQAFRELKSVTPSTFRKQAMRELD